MLKRLIGDHPGTSAEQGRQRAGQPAGEPGCGLAIAAADVGVRQRRLARQAMPGGRQRIVKIAQQQMARVRAIGGMGAHLPLEHEDLPVRQELAQMIVGATVAQAELEHRPRQLCDPGGREVEAGTLRLEPANETVETAHSGSLGQPAEDCRSRCKGQQRIGTE